MASPILPGTGLGSGLDIGSIVTALVNADKSAEADADRYSDQSQYAEDFRCRFAEKRADGVPDGDDQPEQHNQSCICGLHRDFGQYVDPDRDLRQHCGSG